MIAALVSVFLAFQITPEIRQHVDAGLKAKEAGDIETAIREFRRVAELAPDLPAAHVNLGAAYLEKKDYADAIPSLRKGLELNPELPGAQAMLGTALLAQGYSAEAVPHLEKAQANDLLGIALLEFGRAREALDRLEAALEKRPGDPDLLFYLSLAHGQLSKELFERLRTEYPESARTQQMLGDALAAAGNREAAVKHYRTALAVRPDLHGVHFALGELLLEAGDYEKAEQEFRAESRLAPGSAAAAYKLGLVLSNRGRAREALAELQRSDTLRPEMPETLLELGKALAMTGDTEGAEKAFQKVLELEQTSKLAETAHYQLAQIYRKLGRPADADREIKLFQQLKNKNK